MSETKPTPPPDAERVRAMEAGLTPELSAVVRAAIRLDECWRDYDHSHTYSCNERAEKRRRRDDLRLAVAKLPRDTVLAALARAAAERSGT